MPYNSDNSASTIVFSVLQILVFLFSCSGNIVVVVVIAKYLKRKSLANRFIVNLAVADMFTGLASLSQVVYKYVPSLNTNLYTCLLQYQVVICMTLTSQLLVTFTTFDRCVAICFPHKYCQVMTSRVANVLIFISWFYSSVLSVLPFVGLNTWSSDYSTPCLLQLVVNSWQLLWMSLTLWAFTIVTVAMYALILRRACHLYRKIRPSIRIKASPPNIIQVKSFTYNNQETSTDHSAKCDDEIIEPHSTNVNDSTTAKREKTLGVLRGAKALAAITIVFTTCWLPYTYFQIRGFVDPDFLKSDDWNIANWLVFLGMANSVMNPFIYAWQRKDFNAACKRLMSCRTPLLIFDGNPHSQTGRAAF